MAYGGIAYEAYKVMTCVVVACVVMAGVVMAYTDGLWSYGAVPRRRFQPTQ